MPFDASIRRMPPAVRAATSAATPLLPDAAPGDVVAAPDAFEHPALRVGPEGVHVHTLAASRVSVSGADLEELLEACETDRLGPGVLSGASFAPGAVTGDKLSRPLPVSLGGTGLDAGAVPAGQVAFGAAGAIAFSPGLAWSAGEAALTVSGSVRLGEFSVAASNGTLAVAGPGGAVADLLDYSLGVPPSAALVEPDPGASDSNAFLDYSVSDGGVSLHLALYAADTDEPRLPRDVALGDGALQAATVDLARDGTSGSFAFSNLEPVTQYVVRATAADARGNLSPAEALLVRTTEFSGPSVALIHAYATAPGQVGFSASNAPDASDMMLVTGVLTSRTPAITAGDVISRGPGVFRSDSIPAGQALDVAVSLAEAHDPARGLAAEPVAEARTYHPFVLYWDAENNTTLEYGAPLYNPDVTPPEFESDLRFVSATAGTLTVSAVATDAVGVAEARAYVTALDRSLAPAAEPTAAEVLLHGQAASAAGESVLTELHRASDGAAGPLAGTGRYRVYLAAADAAGNSAVQSVDAATLDDADPVVGSLSVASEPGTSNAAVSWEASDPGPHGAVRAVHVLCSAGPASPVPSPAGVVAAATGSFPGPSGSAVFANVPSHLATHVYAVAQDEATGLGNAEDRLSAVRTGSIPVPAVAGLSFAQDAAAADVRVLSSAFSAEAASGPVSARLVLFRDAAASDPAALAAAVSSAQWYEQHGAPA